MKHKRLFLALGLVTACLGAATKVQARVVALNGLTDVYEIMDGDTLTGTLEGKYLVASYEPVTVTLMDVNINATHPLTANFAGIVFHADATVILSGDNVIKGLNENFPAIFIDTEATVTITGDGTLHATGQANAPAIGSTGVFDGGNLIIKDNATVYATGGDNAAAIGSGKGQTFGSITIENTVKEINATKGAGSPCSIGGGTDGTCGTVTVCGDVWPDGVKATVFSYERYKEDVMDDIKYRLDPVTHTATVIDNTYYGDIAIPATVSYKSEDYDVTVIGEAAFMYAYYVTSVSLPASITSIGARAFYNCSSLPSVTLPDGLETIGDEAFAYDYELASFDIPASVRSIGMGAFVCDSKMTAIQVAEGNENYLSEDGILFSKDRTTLVCCPAGRKMAEFAVPDGVRTVAAYGLSYIASLKKLTLPGSVETIADNGLYFLENLKELTVLAVNPPAVGTEAFFNVGNTIPVSVPYNCRKAYSAHAEWSYFSNIKELPLPDKIVFEGVAYHVEKDGDSHFATVVALPEGSYSGTVVVNAYPEYNGLYIFTTAIGDAAFRDCAGLTEVKFPGSVTSIGYDAFRNSGITRISIPKEVTHIGKDAFRDCDNLTAFEVDKDNTVFSSADGVLFGNNMVYAYPLGKEESRYTVPDGVIGIGSGAFAGAVQLTEVVLPATLLSISDEAFAHCTSLTSVVLPAAVGLIGSSAFMNCTGLESVIGYGEAAPATTESDAFDGVHTDIPVIVPQGHTADWSTVSPWSDFSNFLEMPLADMVIDGVCYALDIETRQAAVKAHPYGTDNYNGDLAIPAAVRYAGVEFTVTEIAASAFEGCGKLTSVFIPAFVKSIGSHAFRACTALKSFDADYNNDYYWSHDGLLYSGDTKTLYACPAQAEAVAGDEGRCYLYDGVETVSDFAFEGCAVLKRLWMPNSVTTIGQEAFSGCAALTGVFMDAAAVPAVGTDAFKGVGLDAAVLAVPAEAEKTYAGDAAWGQFAHITGPEKPFTEDGIAYVLIADFDYLTLSASVQPLEGEQRYSGDIVIPEKVTWGQDFVVNDIGFGAFAGCTALTGVTLPASLTHISEEAFTDCTGLTAITSRAATPPHTPYDAFRNVAADIPVYVPKAGIDDYKAASHWEEFTNYIAIEDKEAADQVEEMINAIGEVAYTEECKKLIDVAREAYNALSEEGKALVDAGTLDILNAAEAMYNDMKTKAEEQPTGTDAVQDSRASSRKALRDGNIYILNGDKTYDTAGRTLN